MVIDELISMARRSRLCTHTMKGRINMNAHERTPVDWSTIPTLAESVSALFSSTSRGLASLPGCTRPVRAIG